jgi:hypothetical protein
MSCCALAQMEGQWIGTLEVQGVKLRLVLNLARDGAGYKSTLDSLDQGAKGIPVDFTSVSDGNVTFDVERLKVNFKGKLSADQQTVSGTFTQGGNSLPLELKKTTLEALEALNKRGRPLTADERTRVVVQLEASRDKLKRAIAGLSEAQLKWKQAPDRWSVLEITEHLALLEPMLLDLCSKRVMATLAKPELEARSAEQMAAEDKKTFEGYLDRSKKGSAPEPAKPTGRFATGLEAFAAFEKARAATLEYVKTTNGDLRSHGAPLFGGTLTDAYQVLVMTAAHTERHLLQLDEVKGAAGYPKQ